MTTIPPDGDAPGRVAVINYRSVLDYPAMFPECADRLYVFSHHDLAHTEGLAHYEYVPQCESIPYAELAIRRMAHELTFTHVVTDNEYDLERAAHIREDLGLPGQSRASALAFRDKAVMKETAGRAVRVPGFARLTAFGDLTSFIEKFAYPVVVKPVKQGGSRDISVLRDEDDLLAFSRRPWREDLMAEEFVEGPMYHVDAVISEGYRFVASSRYLRSCLGVFTGHNNGSVQLRPESAFARRLEEYLDRVLAAFDTPGTSAYHLEVFHTPDDELVLCEIASRVGGDRIPQLTELTYGVDLHATTLRAACGLPVPQPPRDTPGEVHGSVSVLPQGRPVRAPGRPPFPWVRHYEVNTRLAPDAVTLHSAHHLCFAVVCGDGPEQVEARLLETERWLMARLSEADDANDTENAESTRGN
ncbi:ATP-grasp domain-containing protein [Streptomyces xanthii]|uniref:ATP-grasp domain-containing protein n=1 Tax=Streptomyces xanthii TaxID=2768069 RepID=A0A7H1BKV1_9ACTN|nr:ATP-grasp domain-containing protein [Streptomyces xanthii]QNS09356.1 ATP-grasp domain-containing protein [Streptomyces xanthii]